MTRGRLLQATLGGGAALVAAGAVGAARGDESDAAVSRRSDVEILNFLLLLEYVQEAFYEHALVQGELEGDVQRYARTVAEQETRHVEFLRRQVGARARERPSLSFDDRAGSRAEFRERAIELEEAAIGAYVGQGANLSREPMGAVARLLSVEARQVAWIRDLAGVSPAPRAADPGRRGDDVLAALRERGYLR